MTIRNNEIRLYDRRKKPPQEGFLRRAKTNYFLTQAGFFSFSFFEQSTFLSSILPPPWLPAKAGADISTNAETSAVITIFIETPSGNEVVEKIQNQVPAVSGTSSS